MYFLETPNSSETLQVPLQLDAFNDEDATDASFFEHEPKRRIAMRETEKDKLRFLIKMSLVKLRELILIKN